MTIGLRSSVLQPRRRLFAASSGRRAGITIYVGGVETLATRSCSRPEKMRPRSSLMERHRGHVLAIAPGKVGGFGMQRVAIGSCKPEMWARPARALRQRVNKVYGAFKVVKIGKL
jgi:hypothetical protein